MSADDEQRRLWTLAASSYDCAMRPLERFWLRRERTHLLAEAAGRTLEAGIGTGVNLPHDPHAVEVIGIDSSPAMLAIAGRRATELDVRSTCGSASPTAWMSRTPASTPSWPSCCCARCWTWPGPSPSSRVLRPGGRLLLLDHVVVEDLAAGRDRLVEAVVARRA